MTRIRYGSRLGWVTLAVAWALLAIPALSSGNAPDSDASELVFWESVKDSGHAEELRAYLKRYPDGTYAVLARIRLERLMVREAMELLSDALSTARSIEDVYFRVRALNVIAEAQAAAGDARGAERAVSEALSTARRVEGAWYRAMLLADTAEAQTSGGNTGAAKRTVSEALSAARNIEDAGERAAPLSVIAAAQAAADDRGGAKRTISETLSITQTLKNSDNRDWALVRIAEVQASLGDTQGAMSTVRDIKSAYHRPWALKAIAESQTSAGEIQGALSNARRISDPSGGFGRNPQARAFNIIAKAQFAAGDTRGAEQTVSEALSITRSIENASPQAVEAFSIIAEGAVRGWRHTRGGAKPSPRPCPLPETWRTQPNASWRSASLPRRRLRPAIRTGRSKPSPRPCPPPRA